MRTFEDEEFVFEDYQQNQSDLMIHEFLINDVKEKINYNVDHLSSRTSYGYANSQGVFSVNYQLNISVTCSTRKLVNIIIYLFLNIIN